MCHTCVYIFEPGLLFRMKPQKAMSSNHCTCHNIIMHTKYIKFIYCTNYMYFYDIVFCTSSTHMCTHVDVCSTAAVDLDKEVRPVI